MYRSVAVLTSGQYLSYGCGSGMYLKPAAFNSGTTLNGWAGSLGNKQAGLGKYSTAEQTKANNVSASESLPTCESLL